MTLSKLGRITLLYDFYGSLLTPKQHEVIRLYYEYDLSLGEIAAEFKISRQAVHDILKRAERSLEAYEAKLGLLAGYLKGRDAAVAGERG